MAFQAVPQGVETVIKMTQNSVPYILTFHTDTGHAVTVTDLDDINSIFDGWITASLAALMFNGTLIHEIVSTDLSVAAGAQRSIVPTTTAGLAGGGAAAGNAALVVSLRTGFTGRSFRGRNYLGGLTQTVQNTATTVTAGYAVAVAAAWQDLIDALNLASFVLSVLSRYTGGALRVVGLLTEIVTVIVNTTLDSQRRRTAN